MQLVSIKTQFLSWFARIKENWEPYLEKKMIIKEHEPDLRERINEAYQEWVDAQNYFNNVSDPVLVDYASYLLQAAESKYMYLLNKARKREKRG
ncbi:MAG: hypothetical protein PWR10_918 [Halanaerobiales bacterium]|nr:hypothetical protein [Halanaerobiales bacterium]